MDADREHGGRATDGGLRAGRPAAQRGLDRVLGLNAVLARALGEARPAPRVGRWSLRAKIGEGGMGVVFRGEDVDTGATVAVKLLERATPELARRFLREARILEGLRHPRIVRHLADGVGEDGTPYLVMEWLEGRDLRARLDAGPLRVEDALRVASAAARGLAGAHAAGVLHRDVKPSNLFLVGASFDDVRLIDFGIARADATDAGLTATGQLVGTPSYMAPEQLEGRHVPASDVWGLGVTLFELLSGRLPFTASTREGVFVAIAHAPAPRLSALCPEVSPALDALVAKMLAKPVEARIGRMIDVATELADLLAEDHTTPRPRGLSHGEREPRRRPRAEPARPPAHVLGARRVLVGRARALGILRALVDESLEDAVANVAIVLGECGAGRSSLLDALQHELVARTPAVRLLQARAEPGARGAFAALRDLVVPSGAAPELTTLLDALDDGRRVGDVADDAQALTDLVRAEWAAALDRWASEGPLAVLLDDADLADPISLRYLARAVEHLRDQPLLLVVTTRSERDAEGSMRALFTIAGARAPVDVELGPLEPRLLAQLARDLAPGSSDAVRAQLVARAAGNPGHVAELARALDDGEATLPASAATRWAQRLARVEPEGRRLLRAASLLGRRVEPELLAAMIGQVEVTPALLAELERLVTLGVLRKTSVSGHDLAFAFVSEPARAAAEALLTAADRVVGHALAAEWWATHGGDPWQIAHHFVAAEQPSRAGPYFVRAARLALAGEDRVALDRLVEDGLAATDEPELRGELHTLAAEGAFWAGDVAAAFERAHRASEERPRWSAAWFRSASVAITAGGQLGRNDVVRALLERAVAEPEVPLDREARDARVVCVGRAITQLGSLGVEVDAWRALVERERATHALGPWARAWAARASVDSRTLHYDRAIEAWLQAHAAHLEARDVRGAAQVLLYLGSFYTWSGAFARAAEVIDDAQHIARRLGAAYLDTWARYARGKLLVETSTPAVALDELAIVVERAQDSPRIRAGAELYRALAATRAGDLERAERFARAVLATPGATALHAPATAALVRVLLLRGAVEGAEAHAPALIEAARGPILEFDALVRLALVELATARGDHGAARAARLDARRALEDAASTLASPLRRQELLRGPHLHAATLDLCSAAEG